METTCDLLPSRTCSSLWVSLKGERCFCRQSVWRVMRPQGRHFLQGIFFFFSWSSRVSIYHETKKSSGFLVTCFNRVAGIEAQSPWWHVSKGMDCSGRYRRKGHWRVLPGDILMFEPCFWSRFACVWHSSPGSCHTCACWRERFVMTFCRKREYNSLHQCVG